MRSQSDVAIQNFPHLTYSTHEQWHSSAYSDGSFLVCACACAWNIDEYAYHCIVLVLMLAISTLGVAGHFTHLLHRSGGYIPLEGLSLATAALTVLTLPIM